MNTTILITFVLFFLLLLLVTLAVYRFQHSKIAEELSFISYPLRKIKPDDIRKDIEQARKPVKILSVKKKTVEQLRIEKELKDTPKIEKYVKANRS